MRKHGTVSLAISDVIPDGETLNDWVGPRLEALAAEFKTYPLPPANLCSVGVIIKPLGSCGTVDIEECASVGAKVTWGIHRDNPENEWDTKFRRMLWK